MKNKWIRWASSEAQRVARRLAATEGGRRPRSSDPEMAATSIQYDVSERVSAITNGGIGVIHKVALKVGLVHALNTRLPILAFRRPNSEADHILHIAYNLLSGGQVLQDLEHRRQDLAYVGAQQRGAPVHCQSQWQSPIGRRSRCLL